MEVVPQISKRPLAADTDALTLDRHEGRVLVNGGVGQMRIHIAQRVQVKLLSSKANETFLEDIDAQRMVAWDHHVQAQIKLVARYCKRRTENTNSQGCTSHQCHRN